ncbi:MAG: tetratricopeptide repeat protein, partial [candidate division NC10 bacterium]|nr:tetratricopeptide repeat protein [candidate division NC10 bacterium]
QVVAEGESIEVVTEAPRTEVLAEEPATAQVVAEGESIEVVTEVPRTEEESSSLSTLADVSRAEGRFAEAERLYKRALAIDEEALEKDHLNVARDVNNLALFYDSRGNDAEAEPLYHRALAIAKKALGPDHPEVATVAANVKGFYEKTGRKVEPEKLKERATEHQAILKLVGVVLIGVGLMDVGYMFYSIYAGKTYASIFSIIAIIAGAFLLNGSLRAARIVATSAAFFVAGLSGVIIALPILLPVDLILTYLKFAPLSDVLLATPFLLAYGLSVWVYHNLTSQPVKAGMDEAGMNYKSFWKSPALGLKIGAVFIVILIVSLVFFLKGEKADRAVEEARKKMGSRYKYQVVSMRTSSSKEATMVQAGIIAYDATSIRYVDVAWKEPDARQTKTKGKGSKKKSRRRK